MKKSGLLLAFLMTVCALAKAQNGQAIGPNNTEVSASIEGGKVEFTPRVRAQQGAIWLQNKLQLDDIQKAKVYAILFNQAKQIDSLRFLRKSTDRVNTCSNNVKFKPIIEESFMQISAILSNEQRRALNKYQKEPFYLTCTPFSVQ